MFLFEPTNWKSRREEGTSEIWCALTSIPIMIVGAYFRDYIVTFAGCMSFLSHLYPYKGVHMLDLFACALIGIKIIINYKTIINNSLVFNVGLIALCLNIVDKYFNSGKEKYPEFHCIWHLYASIALFNFLYII